MVYLSKYGITIGNFIGNFFSLILAAQIFLAIYYYFGKTMEYQYCLPFLSNLGGGGCFDYAEVVYYLYMLLLLLLSHFSCVQLCATP